MNGQRGASSNDFAWSSALAALGRRRSHRGLSSSLAAIAFLLGYSTPAIAGSSAFFLDTRGYWATACIEGLATKDLLRGDGDGFFRPNGTMTRAEFAAVMIKTFPNVPKVRQAPNFRDVAANDWARDAIAQAYEKGFLAGYPGNIFRPTQAITRAQAITILANTQGLAGAQVNPTVLNYFEDRASIPNYAERAVASATLSNFIVNYPIANQLRPRDRLIRGEAAAFLCQVLQQADSTSLHPRYSVPGQYIAKADDFAEAPIPQGLQTQLIAAMRQQLGGELGEYAIASAAPARWRSCNPAPCQPQDYEGLRIKVSGRGETWTYYTAAVEQANAAPNYLVQLDGPTSLNPTIHASLRRLSNRGSNLRILAAKLIPADQSCANPASCAQPIHWQILTDVVQQPFHRLDLQGNPLPSPDFSPTIPTETAGLPVNYITAVLEDIQHRQPDESPQALKLASIKAISWNDCNGDQPKPSEPAQGICQDVDRSGWQLITQAAGPQNPGLSWVHYFRNPLSEQQLNFLRPDGLQSLPQSVGDAVVAAATRYDRINNLSPDPANPNQYRVQWASAQFFDACLQVNPSAVGRPLICRQAMQSGWRVEVIGNQLTSNGGQTLLTYHSNLDGSNVRFNAKGTWFPPS